MSRAKPNAPIPKATHSWVAIRPSCGHAMWMAHDIEWPRKADRTQATQDLANAVRNGWEVKRLAFGSPELKATQICMCKPEPTP